MSPQFLDPALQVTTQAKPLGQSNESPPVSVTVQVCGVTLVSQVLQ